MNAQLLGVMAAVGFMAFGAGVAAAADDGDLQELKAIVEALQERITALEEELNDVKGDDAVAQQAVSERVGELETQIAENPPSESNDFRVYWKDGLRFDTQDGRFKLKIGGRIQNDWVWYDQDKQLEWI